MSQFAICPYCEKAGIVVGPRTWHSRGWPAVCRQCGRLSYDRSFWRQMGYGLLECVTPLLLFGLVFLPGMLRIIALLLGFGYFLIWRRRRRHPPVTRFRPVTPERSLLARRLTYVALLLVVAGVGAAFVISMRH